MSGSLEKCAEKASWRDNTTTSLIERVAGDGQEDVEEGVVSKHGEEDEIQRVDQTCS